MFGRGCNRLVVVIQFRNLSGSRSALCGAPHKADYAERLIMWSSELNRGPTAGWQRLVRILCFT
jgi:hypothetical protein